MNNKPDSTKKTLEDIFESASEAVTLMPVPALAPNMAPPAEINAIALAIRPDGSVAMRITVKRDLTIPIKSFTFRYRFSHLPISAPDNEHLFWDFAYDEADINTSATIVVSGDIPSELTYDGCSAYISEIVLESGQKLTFEASEYRFVRRPVKKAITAKAAPEAPMTDKEDPKKEPVTDTAALKKRKTRRLTVIISILAAILIAEAVAGVCFYFYMGAKNSVDALVKDDLYNEAYKLALESGYKDILQSVCRDAAEYYYENGDLESAYVYAYGAPKPFTDEIIGYAAQIVVNPKTGTINETALKVAKMTNDDEKFDNIIRTIISSLEIQGDFANALRMASEFRNADDGAAAELSVFDNAIEHYVAAHNYEGAFAFIEELANIPTFEKTKDESIAMAARYVSDKGDSAGMIYLAHKYPEQVDASAVISGITPDYPGVRAEMQIVYPMLTSEQRRTYHAETVAIWNGGAMRIENGTLVGTNITNAVSIDSNESATLVLTSNGKVTVITHDKFKTPFTIPEYDDVIAIAAGEAHAVLLHENGTVTVHGDNTYGQANVSEWTDIVAIAAGQRFTLGLKLDGTVVAAGTNKSGQCDVSIYRNVVDIAACNQSSVLLFADGTVKVVGYRSMGLADIEVETFVTRIRAGGAAIVIEKRDGTFAIYSGIADGNYGDPFGWKTISAFDVGLMCIAAVDTSGELLTSGDGLPKY